jgi:hypothetical protein
VLKAPLDPSRPKSWLLLAFRPLRKKFKNPRLLNLQKITHLLLLADLRIVKTERLDQKEKISNVDADMKDLVAAKQSKPLPPSFVFGESKVTANLIREYEAAGFFPAGSGRAPLGEQVPTPEEDEVVVFCDFFNCGLRFPCDPLLPAILDKFSVKIHQLSPNSFLEVS